jgi:hypothetical protein
MLSKVRTKKIRRQKILAKGNKMSNITKIFDAEIN